MPDLFHNDPVALNRPDGFDIQKWRSKHSTDRVDPVVESVVSHIHAELGITRIGAVGYCFGAKYVARFLAPHRGVSVGYMAHPSFVDINELKGMQGPLCIAAAETDEIFPAEKRRETENLLKESGNVYQISFQWGKPWVCDQRRYPGQEGQMGERRSVWNGSQVVWGVSRGGMRKLDGNGKS